jgi:UDP-N-acetylmuramate-alanine ligase
MSLFSNPKRRIEKYVAKYPTIKTIVVCGSYGRKSAIRALAIVLGETMKVTMGVNKNILEDVMILDYNSMDNFPDINPDVCVMTACETDEEAQEYFALANRSKHLFLNFNDVPQKYAKLLMNPDVFTYGDEHPADFYFENEDFSLEGYKGIFYDPERDKLPATVKIIGEHNLRPVTMACGVARLFKVHRDDIVKGVENIRPIHGRMSPAKGLRGSIILDDSATMTATSVKYGLQTIYHIDANTRILVTDDVKKLQRVNYDLISEVLILGQQPEGMTVNKKVKFFDDQLDLVSYLSTRQEDKCLILLEIPIPEIIESYIW